MIANALRDWLVNDSGGDFTFGQNLFIGQVSNSKKINDSVWWIVNNGGGVLTKAISGSAIKQYTLNLFYRGRDYEEVQGALFEMEELISRAGCVSLQGFQVIEIEVISFPIDQDLDSEDRKVGLLQINIKTYKEC